MRDSNAAGNRPDANSESAGLINGISLRQAAVITGFAYLLNPVTFAEGVLQCPVSFAWSLYVLLVPVNRALSLQLQE
jgi:hypothetical protein